MRAIFDAHPGDDGAADRRRHRRLGLRAGRRAADAGRPRLGRLRRGVRGPLDRRRAASSATQLLEMLTKSLPAVALSASDAEVGTLVSILTADASADRRSRRQAAGTAGSALLGRPRIRACAFTRACATPIPAVRRGAGGDPRRARASASTSPTTWSASTATDGAVGRRRGGALRPADARPGDLGAALRPGDLRGPQGLPAARRLDRHVPAGRERARASSTRPGGWPWPSCPTELFVESLRALVEVDRDWVPDRPGPSRCTCVRS